MAQQTLVLKLDATAGRALRTALDRAGWEMRSAPYAHFAARTSGATVTHYESGKLVVQAVDPAAIVRAHIGEHVLAAGGVDALRAGSGAAAAKRDDVDLAGSDECGKGDYLGPLVVACVFVPAGDGPKLRAGGIGDSKTLSDDTIRKLAGALRTRYPHAVEVLDPPAYNAAHAKTPNVNRVLAALHAKAIRALVASTSAERAAASKEKLRVLVDQFADASLMQRELAGLEIALEQRPRGEEEAAVAAASIIARDEFLARMDALSEECGVDLHKGAGRPADDSALRYVELHGFDKLSRVAKVHFKNTAKLSARLDR
ncbi:MAG: ribonuclease HIII [Planctomycetota bacterium]|nr:MAG: ribonuclease HIII [Planctomycetota bacterium]